MYSYLSSFLCISVFINLTHHVAFLSFPVNIKILYQAFIHSINLKKAGVGQPKYCNNAYVHVVLTNLYIYFLFLKFFGLVTIYFDPT